MANGDSPRRRRGDLKPDPEMWAALEEGALMTRALTDFYARVFADPRLSPYFEGVTQHHVVGKQYSFMRQIFTGERIYFGDRPRNAHHWMVISDELFDYREALLSDCLRRAGLPEPFVARWRAVDEIFRKQIVKDRAFEKRLRGVPVPMEGYDSVELSVGSCCDGCQGELPVGTRARYHLRTGRTYCGDCFGGLADADDQRPPRRPA